MTHRDLDALRTEFRGEFALLRGEMKQLRGEVDSKLGAVDSKLGAVDSKLGAVDGRFGGVWGELRAINARIDTLPTTRAMVVTNVGSMIGVATLVLAAAHFA